MNKSKDGEEGEEKAKRKNIIRNPRVMLNDEKLKSVDGVIKLPELFKDVKFKGKNHEKDDLNRIMGIYQNWSHRLMPSLQFDDFIEKAEGLCKKAKMKTFLTKIRNGIPLDIRGGEMQGENDNEVINQYDSDDDLPATGLVDRNMDEEFDDDFMMDDADNQILNDQLLGETQNKIVNEPINETMNEEAQFIKRNTEDKVDEIVENESNEETGQLQIESKEIESSKNEIKEVNNQQESISTDLVSQRNESTTE